MRSPSSFKKKFLKKWMLGLQLCNNPKKEMSISERKNAIKLSADLAMASAKNGSTYWSRALIANASKNCENKFLVDEILGNNSGIIKKAYFKSFLDSKMVHASKKILKRSRTSLYRSKKTSPKESFDSSIIAKKLVKRRTQVLKSLIPGGEFIDKFNILEEILDYVMSLKAQVDVMKFLANATEHLNCK